MSYEYYIYTEPSLGAFSAIACALRQSYGNLIVHTDNQSLHVPDRASGWELIGMSTEDDGFFLVTNLGRGRAAMLEAVGQALSAIEVSWRIEDA
ncbi:hypothetical protein [Burkholderia ubonensis]|uniref:Uncharacterized protein n=1 Tax=Burkholderia ubonensis TaxID=101571 RepID=A0AB74DFR0_9BURK|nr:hypothetical protein [Burkholderia ubonensis]PAJ79861.1 hypothetical protein CJO71_16295 [Burkholderia ubonensis]PAJ90164.1 hypothetical protein CJO70_02210 [Burkholderia ubonensis]PAJ96210.1 hypothetical protein CJO69_00370 [Burkholderia ubonensis]PAK03068.1 hypothetical protein CJO68_02230 [Burkholderia ubonensis]PAK07701.1 hypothetical protein CJO67_13725 [Burkholderia ubonensis]